MSTSIGINPNLRVGDGTLTVADLHEDVLGDTPVPNQEVQVFVEYAGLVGRGWVEEVNEADGTVTVRVVWSSLRLASTVGVAVTHAVQQDPSWSWSGSFPVSA